MSLADQARQNRIKALKGLRGSKIRAVRRQIAVAMFANTGRSYAANIFT